MSAGVSPSVIRADRVVTGTEVLSPGWLRVADGVLDAVTAGEPPTPADLDLGEGTVVPGFVDTHAHGGGGREFSAADPTATRTALDLHREHGTTTLIASLVSDAPEPLRRQVAALADQCDDGLIAGIHLEGPWLSPRRCGAHQPSALRAPDPDEVEALLRAGRGHVRMVTIAPELPGGLDAIRQVADAGVVAAVGHTDATYDLAREAVEAGATVATHLFNAMRAVHHREPGPALALMEDPRVTVEMITDGTHLHPALYRHVLDQVGGDRVSLVTDAMAAAGMPDGAYELGPLSVDVADGVARLSGTDTIAGSTATMDRLFGFALEHGRATGDQALLASVRQTSVVPARALGLGERRLVPGAPADLVLLDSDLSVAGVVQRGQAQ